MADRRSQSDESLIVEYFTVQPLAACDALLNQIADQLRKRRPKKVESGNNAKPTTEPERKPSQKRKVGKEATATADSDRAYGNIDKLCGSCNQRFGDNVHHLKSTEGYHEFVEPAGEASKGVGA